MQKYKKGDFFIFPNKSALKGMDAKAQVVYMWLSSYANNQGQCFPSRKRLSEDTGFKSAKTIDRAIKILGKHKLITKKNRVKAGEKQTNLYQINDLGGRVKNTLPRVKNTQPVGQNLPIELSSIELKEESKKEPTHKTLKELEKIREKMSFRKRK